MVAITLFVLIVSIKNIGGVVEASVKEGFKNRHLPLISEAINLYLKMWEDPGFLDSIKRVNHFDLSKDAATGLSLNGDRVVKLIEDFNVNKKYINIIPVYPWFSRSWYARVAPGSHDTMEINGNRLSRGIESIVGTLWHETMHCIDNTFSSIYMGHGDNSRNGKDHTVPYWVGSLAQGYANELLRL